MPYGRKEGAYGQRYTYRYVNVGSAIVGLIGVGRTLDETGLAATEETMTWQSRRSSPRQGKPGTRRRTAVIVGGDGWAVERTKTYVR